MLIDWVILGLCFCVVLVYQETTPKGGFVWSITRRYYSRPHFPRDVEAAPGVDLDTTRDRKRVRTQDSRPRHSPRGAPRGSLSFGAALGTWEHMPEARETKPKNSASLRTSRAASVE